MKQQHEVTPKLIEAVQQWNAAYLHALYTSDGEDREQPESQRLVEAAAMEYPLLKIVAGNHRASKKDNHTSYTTDHSRPVGGNWGSNGAVVSHTYGRVRPVERSAWRCMEGERGFAPDAVAVFLPIATRTHAAFNHACVLFIHRNRCPNLWGIINTYGFVLPRHDSPDCFPDFEATIDAAYRWKRQVLEAAGPTIEERLLPRIVELRREVAL